MQFTRYHGTIQCASISELISIQFFDYIFDLFWLKKGLLFEGIRT